MKKIAVYYLQNKRSIAKGCLYLSKLLQSKATTHEDRVFALPYLIQYHVDEAAQLIAAPHRSPNAAVHDKNPNHESISNKSVKGEIAPMT